MPTQAELRAQLAALRAQRAELDAKVLAAATKKLGEYGEASTVGDAIKTALAELGFEKTQQRVRLTFTIDATVDGYSSDSLASGKDGEAVAAMLGSKVSGVQHLINSRRDLLALAPTTRTDPYLPLEDFPDMPEGQPLSTCDCLKCEALRATGRADFDPNSVERKRRPAPVVIEVAAEVRPEEEIYVPIPAA